MLLLKIGNELLDVTIEGGRLMKGFLYIDEDNIGEVIFSVTDESMGVIGGDLIANDNYRKYQATIQQHFEKKRVSNMDNFNFRVVLRDESELKPEGGIGVTDSAEFGEIYVEAAGLDVEIMNNIKKASSIS